MPIYEYECDECGYRFEVRQSFNDEPIKTCQKEKCDGKVHKVFSPPAIIFKGPGFYVTDNGRGSGGGRHSSSKPCNEGSKEACKTCDKAKSD